MTGGTYTSTAYPAIIGEDEANAGTVMLKDMATGEQRAVLVSELPDAVR